MNMKNQNGYTLITTLLIATLIVTASFVLIGMALNTNKQIQLSEQDMQATDLAEMGLTYFQEKVNEIVANYTNAKDIAEKVKELNNKTITVTSSSSETKQFKIALDSLLINKDNLSAQVTFYGCVGNCEDPTSKKETIRSTLQLSKAEGSGATVVISHDNQEVKVESCSNVANKNNGKIETNCYFLNQDDLNSYLEKNELRIHNGATVYILSDIVIDDLDDLKFTGNNNQLCVYGGLTFNSMDKGQGNNKATIYAYEVMIPNDDEDEEEYKDKDKDKNEDRDKDRGEDENKHKQNNITIIFGKNENGEYHVNTYCGTYSLNRGNWTAKLTNIQYD
jgi:type II secretory pathway pseudopilin PulG